uniref:Uncharacterized protein n=1 Tax=Anguilla anguilla TaxID=7936 RepID=A0A0E9RHJ4_ANGAN
MHARSWYLVSLLKGYNGLCESEVGMCPFSV